SALKKNPPTFIRRGALRGTVATGRLFHPILAQFVSRLNEQWGTRLQAIAVDNHFFGQEITVAGLLAGGGFFTGGRALAGDFLLVPEQACLKAGHIFLDDLTVEDLQKELSLPVAHSGETFLDMLERAHQLESR